MIDLSRHEALEDAKRLLVAELVPSVNAFIPKPHTPYEDQPLAEEGLLRDRLGLLQRELSRIPNVVFRGMPVGEAVWEAFLAKVDESGADILEEAASGVPVRRLLKAHRARIAAVVRPQSVLPAAGAPAPVAAPWSFISKR